MESRESFDVIGAAGDSYKNVWEERVYILKLAFVPFFVKLSCYMVALRFGFEENMLRFSLLLVPAYFFEGWMLSHIVRTAFTNHRWPFRFSSNREKDMAEIKERARGIMAGAVGYTLVNMVLGAVWAVVAGVLLQHRGDGALVMDVEDVQPGLLLAMIFGMALTVWGFRFIWFYIPLCLNYPLRDFISKMDNVRISYYLIAVWLMCFIPLILVMQFIASVILMPFVEGEIPVYIEYILVVLGVIFDTCKSIVCTLGIAYGMKQVFSGMGI